MMTDDKNKPDSGMERFIAEYLNSSGKKNAKIEDSKKLLANEFNSKKTNGLWNIDNFINACNQLCPNLKWQNVFGFFDRPKLEISSEDHFLSLMKAF
jgi:hypothetical protein